ncbi:MAG: hypothetical protein WCA10_00725 [Terracidiphilus sp.]
MAESKSIREMLVPGKRLDAGRACEVGALLLKNPRKTGRVLACLWDETPGVANRAADALERASCRRPEILASWKDALLDRMLDASENKLRWNLALMIFRTPLSKAETERAAAILRSWLDDQSSIVKTSAMHGLAGLTRWDPSLLPEVMDMLRLLSRSGTPAMRARGRILLKQMEAGKKLPVVTGALHENLGGDANPSTTRTAARKTLQALRYG